MIFPKTEGTKKREILFRKNRLC